NAPLGLPAGGVWRVEAGEGEGFACRETAGGTRIHLAAVPAGGLIFGADEAWGLGLLAVGSRDSHLTEIGAARVRRAAGDPTVAPALAPLLDGWISRLLGEALRAAAPKAFVELRPGEETVLEREGMAARPAAGVVWVRCLQGGGGLLGPRGRA